MTISGRKSQLDTTMIANKGNAAKKTGFMDLNWYLQLKGVGFMAFR